MIKAQHLSRSFGPIRAVQDVSFEVQGPAVVGMLGPNGAGKTTTIRMMAGYLRPSRGSVLVHGLDVARRPLEVRRRLGYLPESTPLYGELTVRELLRFWTRIHRVPRSRRRAAVDQAIERCGLSDVRRRIVRQLSKGYRQRVGLAAAIVHEPPIIILDEPTVGLDPSQIRDVRALIRQLGEERTVFLSTHILPEVEMVCDQAIVIAAGRVRAQGALADLMAQKGSRAYRVEADRDVEAVLAGVEGVKQVRTAGRETPWLRFDVEAESVERDLREPIARAVARAGATARELVRQAVSLEELYIRITAEAALSSDPEDQAAGKGGKAA